MTWKPTRRQLLRAGLATAGAAGLAGVLTLTGIGTEHAGVTLNSDLAPPAKFRVPLPIPPVARPANTADGIDRYAITQRQADVEIIPGTRTRIWGYDGIFPGPTIRAHRGRPAVLTVTNELPVPTSTHLHGGVTPAESDGFPTDVIVPHGMHFMPGAHSHMEMDESSWTIHHNEREYHYPFDQRAATLWYHDHRMDFTAPQVWRGLAGLCIVNDDQELALPLPNGEFEVPLVLLDRAFHADASFKYPSTDDTLLGEPGVEHEFHQGVQGDILLVNGAPWPVLDVTTNLYRFRVLNACNSRRFHLTLDPTPTNAPFTHIGSDQGLLGSPQGLSEIVIAPGERFDVVIDFSQYPPGTTVRLANAIGEANMADVMQFRVTQGQRETSAVPDILDPPEDMSVIPAKTQRTFQFNIADHATSGQPWVINGQGYHPEKSIASVPANTVERWVFSTDFHHPVHVHLGHFQVISRNGRAPLDRDAGMKDTVDIRPLEVVEVAIKFPDYYGRYMMHCHNLEHEDMAMMANFDVVK